MILVNCEVSIILSSSAPAVQDDRRTLRAGAAAPEETAQMMAQLAGLPHSPLETRDVRGSVLQVLERFALSEEEYAALTPLRTQMQGR